MPGVHATTDEAVFYWRLEQLLDAGYTLEAGEQLAARTDIDLHRACALLREGCTVPVALEILL